MLRPYHGACGYQNGDGVPCPHGIGWRCASTIEEDDGVTFVAEGDFEHAACVIEDAKDPDYRSRINRFAKSFVIETDVAAGDRSLERVAGFREALDSFAELPHHFRLLRATEIEAICGCDGTRAAGSDIASGFGDGVHRAEARTELAPSAVAV